MTTLVQQKGSAVRGAVDTYTDSDNPSTSHGDDASITIGNEVGVRQFWAWLQFDLSGLDPDSKIISAVLDVNVNSAASSAEVIEILSPLSNLDYDLDFLELDTFDGLNPWPVPDTEMYLDRNVRVTDTMPTGTGAKSFADISQFVRRAIRQNNHQLILVIKKEDQTEPHEKFFIDSSEHATIANRPKLTITTDLADRNIVIGRSKASIGQNQPSRPRGTGGGSGDVKGPALTTVNALAAWLDTTGTVLRDSNILIDAAGDDLLIPGDLTVETNVDIQGNLDLSLGGTLTTGGGLIDTEGGNVDLGGGDIVWAVGYEMRHDTGSFGFILKANTLDIMRLDFNEVVTLFGGCTFGGNGANVFEMEATGVTFIKGTITEMQFFVNGNQSMALFDSPSRISTPNEIIAAGSDFTISGGDTVSGAAAGGHLHVRGGNEGAGGTPGTVILEDSAGVAVATIGSTIIMSADFDLNGQDLIGDADGDSKELWGTDDEWGLQLGGAEVERVTATIHDFQNIGIDNFEHLTALSYSEWRSSSADHWLDHGSVGLSVNNGVVMPFDYEIVACTSMMNVTTATLGNVKHRVYINNVLKSSADLTYDVSAGTGWAIQTATGLSITGSAGDFIGIHADESAGGIMVWVNQTYTLFIKMKVP